MSVFIYSFFVVPKEENVFAALKEEDETFREEEEEGPTEIFVLNDMASASISNAARISGFTYKKQFQPYRPTMEQLEAFHKMPQTAEQPSVLHHEPIPNDTKENAKPSSRRDKGKEKVDEYDPAATFEIHTGRPADIFIDERKISPPTTTLEDVSPF